jgi:hypothetical protein
MAPVRKVTLSDDNCKKVKGLADKVWNDIGYDCLQAVADGFPGRKPRDINTVTMSRADVIEVVLDADRLTEELRAELRHRRNPELESFLAAWQDWEHADNPAARRLMTKLMREAFPYARYGM